MFNREEMATYHALIVATDKGDPVQNTTKNMTISIIDVNEFPPKFKLSNYSVALLENFTAGMEILRVSATDQDAGDIFGHVTFGIASGNADDIFTINGTTVRFCLFVCAFVYDLPVRGILHTPTRENKIF